MPIGGPSIQERVVDVVLKDLRGRAGLDAMFDSFDADIRADIRNTLIEKVGREIFRDIVPRKP